MKLSIVTIEDQKEDEIMYILLEKYCVLNVLLTIVFSFSL